MSEKPEPQPQQDGTGPLFHRRYSVHFVQPEASPETVLEQVQKAFDLGDPVLLTAVEKISGRPGKMALEDVYAFKMLGVLGGKVKVVEISDTAFCFETLEGHPQAGRICFSAARIGPQTLGFSVESWARSRDALVQLIYEHMGIGKRVQTRLWTSFCRHVAQESGGQIVGKVQIKTRTLKARPRHYVKQ